MENEYQDGRLKQNRIIDYIKGKWTRYSKLEGREEKNVNTQLHKLISRHAHEA